MPRPPDYAKFGKVRLTRAFLWECKTCAATGIKLTQLGAGNELKRHAKEDCTPRGRALPRVEKNM